MFRKQSTEIVKGAKMKTTEIIKLTPHYEITHVFNTWEKAEEISVLKVTEKVLVYNSFPIIEGALFICGKMEKR